MSDCKAYVVCADKRTNLSFSETTVGRLSSNLIAINDPTVSKNHAAINFVQSEGRFFICDLSTVNGTYLNGSKLQPHKKYPIRHKDAIQFDPNLFYFYQSQPQHQKKGKINLKDYCFELDSDEETSRPVQTISQPQPSRQLSSVPARQLKAVKIPNLADYLQLDDSLLSSNPSLLPKGKETKFERNPKVQLVSVDNQFNEEELRKLRQEEERSKNIYLSQQADRLEREARARALEEEKIRLEIERHKQEEEMLRRQIELENKVKQQQERMNQQKRKIEEELIKREQQRRERQKRAQEEQNQKQRRFVEQMQQEKEVELQKIKEQQELQRTKSEAVMRDQLQKRKKELEIEAQALASQYEQIYRETIRKMKNDIEKEESQIQELEKNIENIREGNAQLQFKVKQVGDTVEYTQNQFQSIAGRNKAFILYASELQNRLDQLKQTRGESQVKISNNKVREEIESSRKLLSMKRGELKSLEDEIGKLRITLNLDKRGGSIDMLDTILSNHESIQRSKLIYFEYLREEKSLKDNWECLLEDIEHLEQQNISIQKQTQNNKKELVSNLRDNASRLTEQQLHMLKCLHYLPEEKKRAAKLLIEQMVAMEEEIRGMIGDSEEAHDKINELISSSERSKEENEYLSQLLFGADSLAHHFDNMKIQINELIERIELERDDARISKRLKAAEQIENNEIKMYQLSKKVDALKSRWREGLKGQKVILAEKNPIVFFGDLLTKKQKELYQSEFRASQLQRECASVLVQTQQLQRKKMHLSDNLQTFKREELAKVRENLL